MERKETAMYIIDLTMTLKKLVRTLQTTSNNRGFSESQYRTLAKLEKTGKSPLKRLSESMAVSTSSLCIMLNKLSEENLVSRETDISDRRNTLYELTEQGKEVLSVERGRMIKELDVLIDTLDENERTSMTIHLKELKKIFNHMEQNYQDN